MDFMNFLSSITDVCKGYSNQKKMFDRLGVKYLSNVDIDVCNYILNQISIFDGSNLGEENIVLFNLNLFTGNKIPFEELCQRSVEEFKIFDDVIYQKIKEVSKNVVYCNWFEGDLRYAADIGYPFNKLLRKVNVDSPLIYGVNIPYKYYDLSVYLMAHEYIHCLKDTNYKEFVDVYVVGEVLTIFYELINIENKLGNELLQFRIKNTMSLRKDFSDVTELINAINKNNVPAKEKRNYELYKYYRGLCGVYLNSFYYAVVLYSMYKETPKKILDMVSKVLKHELTTLEMLEQLGIYGDVRGELFEKELGMIKKRIK